MVHLSGNASQAQFAMEVKCQVKHRRVGGQGDWFALGGEDHNLARKEVEFQSVKEVNGVRFGAFEDILDGLNPEGKLALFVALAILIFPVGGKSALGDIVHSAGADLNFHPVAVMTHNGQMQSLIAIGLGDGNPVACAVRMELINISDG